MAKKAPTPAATPEEVALHLETTLALRRQRTPATWESAQGVHKRRYTRALEKLEEAASLLSQDVAGALVDRVDELSTYSHEFRVGMNRVFCRVLRAASTRQEQVVLFNEAVPGFTLLLFKKDPSQAQWNTPEMAAAPAAATQVLEEAPPEIVAAGHVIAQFVQRTGDRVLTVESDDALFVFLPASDVKKNLKEMGFYHTE